VIGLVSQPPIKEIDASKNKCFHAEITIDYSDIPYEINSLTNELSTDVNFNHGYNTGFSYFDGDNFLLKNPTEKNPISIAEFLGKYLELDFIKDIFTEQYGSVDYHFRFPLDSMIKASMVRRIKCMRSFQKLVNRFETNQRDAKSIGFQNNGNGRCKIPDRRTFRHWENVRIDNQTLEVSMDKFVINIREELEKHDIILGKRVGIDSTPLEALFNDNDAGYSGHYKMTGYKIHGAYCLDTNTPLAIIITPMNESDPNYFKPLLSKLKELGIKFDKIFADGAYDTFEHFALIHHVYKAVFYTNPGTNAICHEKGNPEGIQHEYNRLRNKDGFLPPDKVTFEDKLDFLMKYGKYKPVGAYFRNKFLKNWEQWQAKKKEGDQSPYNYRNACEGFHGFVKQWLNLQNYFDYRGIRNVERHVRWTYLALLGVALARVKNGIANDLTQIAFFE
jgi:hypothetical protein